MPFFFSDSTVANPSAYTATMLTSDTRPTSTHTTHRWIRNWREPLFEPLDNRSVHESIVQMARIRMFTDGPYSTAVRKLEHTDAARPFRHLPRGKLDRWRSLKEKRRAWGFGGLR